MRSGLGLAFPFACQDGQGNAGTDSDKLNGKMAAYGVIRPDECHHAGTIPPMAKSLT